MKYCVFGLGFQAECGKDATTTREGWPMCDEHAVTWDGWEAMAKTTPDTEEGWLKGTD